MTVKEEWKFTHANAMALPIWVDIMLLHIHGQVLAISNPFEDAADAVPDQHDAFIDSPQFVPVPFYSLEPWMTL